MGWSVGFDAKQNRFVGYGVPAVCEHPKCHDLIDRGLSHVCGGEPFGGETGCGLYFCERHLKYSTRLPQPVCDQCLTGAAPFPMKPERQQWLRHLLEDSSWAQWRAEHPREVERIKLSLATAVDRYGKETF